MVATAAACRGAPPRSAADSGALPWRLPPHAVRAPFRAAPLVFAAMRRSARLLVGAVAAATVAVGVWLAGGRSDTAPAPASPGPDANAAAAESGSHTATTAPLTPRAAAPSRTLRLLDADDAR